VVFAVHYCIEDVKIIVVRPIQVVSFFDVLPAIVTPRNLVKSAGAHMAWRLLVDDKSRSAEASSVCST
jgi:hypothetical protein